MADTPVPVRVAYFCKTRWGAHAEFVELFTRVCLSPRTPTILPSCRLLVVGDSGPVAEFSRLARPAESHHGPARRLGVERHHHAAAP